MTEQKTGSSEWLNKLADDIRRSTDYTQAAGSSEDDLVKHLRIAAGAAERREKVEAEIEGRRVATVTELARERWEAIRDSWEQLPMAAFLDFFGKKTAPAWDELEDSGRASLVEYAMKVYRAGLADREADA